MRETKTKGFYWRWCQAMYQFRWIVLVLWVVLLAGFSLVAPNAPDLFKENGFTPYGTESDLETKQLKDDFGFPSSTLSIVYKSDQGPDDLQTTELIKTIRELDSGRLETLVTGKATYDV